MLISSLTASGGETTLIDTIAKLGPIATGASALAALIVGVWTLILRARADRREHWWRQAQWALDLTLNDDPARAARGYRMLDYLARSRLARKGEAALLESATEGPLESAGALSDDENSTATTGQEGDDDQ